MSKEMFLKIVDEVAEKNPSITFSPFYFGEPLMDKNLFEKIIYCKKKCLTYIKLSTNGSLFSVNDNYKKLVDCGVDHLIISFDGITKKTYESIRIGSKFKNFMDGVNKLMEYKKDSGSSMRITGQMINMDYNSSHKKEFIKYCEEKELEPYFASFQFWGQPVKGVEGLEKLRYPCNNPLYSAVILHNGDLVACCMDFEGKCVFGNLKENTLEDLWKKKHKLLRQAQINGEYTKFPVCDGCSDWMSFGYNRFAKIIR